MNDTPDLTQLLHEHNLIAIQDDDTYFLLTPEAGTAGYILKGASIKELVAIIRKVIQESVLIPHTPGLSFQFDFLDEIKAIGGSRYEQLTTREREVVRLIGKGCTNKEIAERLSISVRTVERHRSSIINKLNLQNRSELIVFAVQQSLLGGGI